LQNVGPIVGHDDHSNIRIDGAKWIVRGLGLAGTGECVEESGLTHIGQADDASFEHKVQNVSRPRKVVNGKAVK
jgi:hypothetical protein